MPATISVETQRSPARKSSAGLADIARLILASVAYAGVLLMPSCKARPPADELYLRESHSAEIIPRFAVLELTFKHSGRYDNNFLDLDIAVVFTSPRGMEHRGKGFYYGGDLWKVRFRPDEPGRWTYTYEVTGKGGFSRHGDGVFQCVASDAEGPVLRNRDNPYRWVFANGEPFSPVGLQDCVIVQGSKLMPQAIDGEKRSDPARPVSWDQYFSIYGQAGFNLFRFSQKNCSFALADGLDHYREAESSATDDLLSLARQHGFRVMFGFFGAHGNWSSDSRFWRVFKRTINKALGTREEALWAPDDRKTVAKEKRFIDYCIARWGVYVDFWELLNEREASDKWTTLIADYVRSVDPDRKPISTSWEKPHLPAIDIEAPHWYESESELQSDLRVQQLAAKWKQAGKPVIVGEQGNTGMNWDPLSAVRMRIRTWTALFQEISLIFWNTSWSKAGMNLGRYVPGQVSNIYLGPEERGYIRVLQDFASRLDAGVRMAPVKISSSSAVRTYGLISSSGVAAYLHHVENHATPVDNAEIGFDFPSNARAGLVGEWIDPATGAVVARLKIPPGPHTLKVRHSRLTSRWGCGSLAKGFTPKAAEGEGFQLIRRANPLARLGPWQFDLPPWESPRIAIRDNELDLGDVLSCLLRVSSTRATRQESEACPKMEKLFPGPALHSNLVAILAPWHSFNLLTGIHLGLLYHLALPEPRNAPSLL